MAARGVLIVVAVFWVVMNLLLWRHEFRPEGEPGEEIPVDVVLEKILRSPDLSSLEIKQRGRRIGYCRVLANQAETTATGRTMSDTGPLEGEVRNITGYTLDLDGSISQAGNTNRYRFYVTFQVTTNLDWNVFSLQVSRNPNSITLNANATNQMLSVTYKDADFQAQHDFTFEQLRNPRTLASEIGGPLVGILISGATASLPSGWQDPKQLAKSVQWEARNDKLKISQGYARVYRLQANLGERRNIVILVSRVGEILKIDLPHGLSLVNDEARMD